MSANKISRGERLDVVLGATTASGDVVVAGDILGIATIAGVSGDTVAIDTKGVFECPKATGQAWAVGNTLYWDATAKNFTTTSTSNKRAGIAAAVQLSADTTGYVKINPFIG